jgi:hypothetical protein
MADLHENGREPVPLIDKLVGGYAHLSQTAAPSRISRRPSQVRRFARLATGLVYGPSHQDELVVLADVPFIPALPSQVEQVSTGARISRYMERAGDQITAECALTPLMVMNSGALE